MQENRIRIVDIAEELGVSTATVSNVIHGKTKKISDETVKRVQELLEKKAYIPSMAGILLAQNSSRIVGVVVNRHEKYEGHVLEDGFVSSSLNALVLELEKVDCFMMVKVTKELEDIVRFASMWNMEGLILLGFCATDCKQLREAMHIPFVVYDGYFEDASGICNLLLDSYDGGKQAGEYLTKMGHKRILCIADNYTCMDKERMDGCREVCIDAHTEYLEIPMSYEKRMIFYEEKLSYILSFSAAFVASDFYAAELIHFLQKHGLQIPTDFSIIGFDDSPISRQINPSLSTIRQDPQERAVRAVQLLKQLKKQERVPGTEKVAAYFVERESVRKME